MSIDENAEEADSHVLLQRVLEGGRGSDGHKAERITATCEGWLVHDSPAGGSQQIITSSVSFSRDSSSGAAQRAQASDRYSRVIQMNRADSWSAFLQLGEAQFDTTGDNLKHAAMQNGMIIMIL